MIKMKVFLVLISIVSLFSCSSGQIETKEDNVVISVEDSILKRMNAEAITIYLGVKNDSLPKEALYDALRILDSANSINKTYRSTYDNKLLIFEKLEMLDSMVNVLEEKIMVHPNSVQSMSILANLKHSKGDTIAAFELNKKVLTFYQTEIEREGITPDLAISELITMKYLDMEADDKINEYEAKYKDDERFIFMLNNLVKTFDKEEFYSTYDYLLKKR